MLVESSRVHQIEGEPRRRVFTDEDFDLIVWYEQEHNRLIGFQLCYNKQTGEQALTWREANGFSHHSVDGGEDGAHSHKRTSILTAKGGVVTPDKLAERFQEHSQFIESAIVRFVQQKLTEYTPNL
jgi:hypothetical protein